MTTPAVVDPNKQRISRNVDKMLSQGATDAEVEEYLQSEGLQPQGGGEDFSSVRSGGSSTAEPELPKVGHAEGLGRAAGQGLSMGFSDELEAAQRTSGMGPSLSPMGVGLGLGRHLGEKLRGTRGLSSLVTGDNRTSYERERDQLRAKQESYADENPVKSGLANVAGALPTAAVSLPGLLGRSAVAGGAAAGAATGLGTAEGDVSRQVKSTVQGAGLGGALGGLVGAGVRLGKHVGGALLTRLNMRPKADLGPIEGTETLARRYVRNQFERDNITPEEAIAELQPPSSFYHASAQTPEIVADAGGEMVKRALAGVQSMPGKIAGQAKEVLEGRTAGQFDRITDGVRRVLGVADDDADRVATELVEARRAASKPLYEAAYGHGSVDDKLINKLMENRHFVRAWVKARNVARDEGVKLRKVWKITGTRTTATGKKVPIRERVEVPDVRTLDYVKRELDGIIKKGLQNTGKGGMSSTEAQAVRKLRNRFVDRLDKIVPEYRAARQKFATDLSAEEALENGRNIFSRNTRLTSDEVAALSDADREMFLVGAYRAIRDRMGSIGDHRDLTKVLNNPDVRGQLQQIARSPDEFDDIMSLLGSEINMAETAAKVQGSRTPTIGSMQNELAGVSPDVQAAFSALGRGSVLSASGHALRAMFNRNAMPAGQVGEEVGNTLLQPATPQNLQRIFQPDPVSQPVAARLTGMAGGAIASPSLSSDPGPARMEALSLRGLGKSDAELEAHLASRYTPEVVRFIIAATPQRVPQQ